MAEALNLDWGKGGQIWEVWKTSPCCGSDAPDPMQAVKCIGSWYCCGPCSAAKLLAYTLGQDCGIVNHLLPSLFCGPCVGLILRHNVRVKEGIGANDPMGWVGDILLSCFCGPCSFCQILRTVPPDAWDFVAAAQSGGVKPTVDFKSPVLM